MPSIDTTDIDPIKLLSHSSLETLHSCPRKFEIYRMNYAPKGSATIDMAFGHAVGVGIQTLLEVTGDEYSVEQDDLADAGLSDYQQAIWKAFLSWDVDIHETKLKNKKAFHHACIAIEIYQQQILPHVSNDWELATFNNKPAVELGFIISLPNGYYYRGYVDAVLKHKHENRFRVLELKTTGLASVDVAQYKNSFQGVGYGVVLDQLAAQENFESDYYVDYLVYKTSAQEFLTFPFIKTNLQRVRWLNQLLVETAVIDVYKANEIFPMHGESCYNYYRQCNYFGMCERDNSQLRTNVKASSIISDADYADAFDISSLYKDKEVEVVESNTSAKVEEPKRVIEEFDFIISFEELLSQQQKNIDNSMNKLGSDAMEYSSANESNLQIDM